MPRPDATRTTLDKASVVRAAAQIVNREGAQALTVNRLARELGIQPPSLYNHIGGLPELWRELYLLSVRALGERMTTAALGKSGPAGVKAVAKAYRDYVRECPGLYQASLRVSGKREQPDAELQAAEEQVTRVALALVESFGLSGEDAIHAVRALRSAVHGFATLEAAGGFGLPVDLDESFDRLVEMVIRGLEEAGAQS